MQVKINLLIPNIYDPNHISGARWVDLLRQSNYWQGEKQEKNTSLICNYGWKQACSSSKALHNGTSETQVWVFQVHTNVLDLYGTEKWEDHYCHTDNQAEIAEFLGRQLNKPFPF